jgi:hypothetical protein
MIYYLVQEIIDIKDKHKKEDKRLELPAKKKVFIPTFVFKNQSAYDFESFINLRGYCEDHAITLADWLIGQGYDARVAIGTVKFRAQPVGGHAWVVLFKDNKEYILEATRKQKWNLLPLASTLANYFPTQMFNREDIWTNKSSDKTTKYSGKMWLKSGKFIAHDSYLSSAIQIYTTMQCKSAPLRNTYLAEISNKPASLFCFNL